MHNNPNMQHFGTMPPEVNPHGAGFAVKVSCVGGAGKIWNLPVRDAILVGRAAHCNIMLDDPSVARQQCEIITAGGHLAVRNLSSTNITILNGTIVSETAPLQPGDTLVLGREVLRIDNIQTPGTPQPVQVQMAPQDNYGYTESIF